MVTHSSFLAWRIPWWRSLVGYSPWGCKELDMTETEQRPNYWSTLCFLAVLGLHYCAGFSLVVVSGDCSLVAVWGHLTAVASLVAERGLKVAWAQALWHVLRHTGLLAPRPVGSSGSVINLCLLQWQADSLWLRHQGSPWSTLEEW